MTQKESESGIFITGTDTGVGKTHVGARLIEILVDSHIPVQPLKPVESGCESDGRDLLPSDGLKLMQAAGLTNIDTITPYRFRQAISPPRAATLSGQNLTLTQLVNACTHPGDNYLVVEGAGGFLSPLAEDGLNADLAAALNLPVLIVVADRLGCVNHCLLTLEAVTSRGLDIAAIVLNRIDSVDQDMDNLGEMKRLVDVPVYPDSELETLAQHLITSTKPHK